jgi:G6PDH family F420-dependent oxidoreductase
VTSLPITTAVTCPLVRTHPAIVAHAAATSAVITGGRFVLGVGTGEALNEHIIDSRWPPAEERREMLEEAVEVMRRLWTGKLVTHRGRYYNVDTARLYTLPDEPPPVYMSGFGKKAVELAGRIADGFICTMPDRELVEGFRAAGGAGKPTQGGFKVCWGQDVASARQLLPLPRHFEQLSQLVTEDMIEQNVPCGPDPERHVQALREYVDAGYDEVYVNQIGPEQEEFFAFYAEQVLPEFA